MCGIYGIIGLRDKNLLQQMGKTIAHRGPDDQDEYIEGNIGLGYRRLAIIDTQGSFQPLFNEDKSVVLFFNGEIYNYKELREQLSRHSGKRVTSVSRIANVNGVVDSGPVKISTDFQGKQARMTHTFATVGDGEVIIHLYEQFGPEKFKDLNGIFGFSLYDKKRNKLILARDHFGVKPVYYYSNKNIFVFASEIKAILPVLKNQKIKIAPNNSVIQKYLLTRLHDDEDETFFEGIKRLPPSSYLEFKIQNSEFKIHKYWQLEPKNELVKPTEQENIAEFRRLFLDSIKKQLMSEVPIGTALSGGLDSSAVVMAVNQEIKNTTVNIQDLKKVIGERQKTFSARFPSEANDEDKYINIVNETSGADSHLVHPKREEMWQDMEKLISFQDEPMISSGPYAQWKVAELAKQNKIRVLLDGQGADEMLAGYIAYYFVYLKELLAKGDYINLIKESILSLDVLWPFIKEKMEYLLGIKKTFEVASLFRHSGERSDSRISNVHMSDSGHLPAEASAQAGARMTPGLNERLIQDIFHSSLPSLLRYEDHNSMAHSIEARVPFLDYRLVEFVASLPSNYKIRNGWNKWIMREALKGLLPEEIRLRRWKVGFTTPEISWIRNSAIEVRKILNSESFNARPYFNSRNIRDKFEQFACGRNDESMVFWRIINLELWMRIFIDKN